MGLRESFSPGSLISLNIQSRFLSKFSNDLVPRHSKILQILGSLKVFAHASPAFCLEKNHDEII
ncbi:MAG: hypothetical protein C4530_23925 [Desulfobacteraceae bacterium]|nr:MAG: hypothetical protein C4530_23925 [Desulfobacteraceae bacterium]